MSKIRINSRYNQVEERKMDHVAIMKKSWGMLERIISGEKTIESRWFIARRKLLDNVSFGDTLYFKDSGEPVTVRARVNKTEKFVNLNPKKVSQILNRYHQALGISSGDLNVFHQLYRNKKYCILVFLTKPEKVVPFEINKEGFGQMASWMSVEDIKSIKA